MKIKIGTSQFSCIKDNVKENMNKSLDLSDSSNDNLVGYWTTSTNGNTVLDLSGNSNDGTLQGNTSYSTIQVPTQSGSNTPSLLHDVLEKHASRSQGHIRNILAQGASHPDTPRF